MLEEEKLKVISDEMKEWEQNLSQEDFSFTQARDSSDRPLSLTYTPSDLDGFDYLEKLGFPGDFPFTRGVQPNMYRGKFWTMRQYAGFGDAFETNKRFKFLLKSGQMGLSCAFDLPTQMGYDSDHPQAEGEVGKAGVAVDTVEDFNIVFKDIPLDGVSTSMTINATASILLGMYMGVAESRGISMNLLSGTVQNDLLKEYIARGTYIFPPKPSMRLTGDVIMYCAKYLPKWNPISISGYHIREAGSSAVQEVAFTLANGIAYVEHVLRRGISVDEFAPRLSFFFNAHNNVLEEVAKFRAARRLWAKIMKERFGARDSRSMLLRFHAQTAGCALAAQQPENNVVRVTLQALAAVLGGAQSIHTNSWDEALCLPAEDAARLALRTQQVIGYESGVASTVDPLGGSYFVEHMTSRIEGEAEKYIGKIDGMGGALSAIEKGYQQKEIHDTAFRYQKEIEAKEQIVVGVNEYISSRPEKVKVFKVSSKIEKRQKERLRVLKKNRSNPSVQKALSHLKKCAEGDENLMPYIFEAARARATLGEISDALRDVFGLHRPAL